MDHKIVAVVAITIVLLTFLFAVVKIAKIAFAPGATELGDDAGMILRVSVVTLIILAAIIFAFLNKLSEAIPFLSPIAAFALGGIKPPK